MKRQFKRSIASAAILLAAALLPFHKLPPAVASGAPSELPGRGVKYQRYVSEEAPWAIHVVRIDRSRKDLELVTTMGKGAFLGLSKISSQIRAMPKDAGTPLAAINGDFYETERDTDSYYGDPRGLQICRGEIVSSPGGASSIAFWVDPSGAPQIGRVTASFHVEWADGTATPFTLNEERNGRTAVIYTPAIGPSTATYGGVEFVLEGANEKWLPLRAGEKYSARIREIRRNGGATPQRDILILSFENAASLRAIKAAAGDVVAISTATTPDLKGVSTAIGGGPVLVRNSQVAVGSARRSGERHPRSAVGWNEKEIMFVEVDGRQRHSIGMDLDELAEFMVTLGCQEAMNLDGGGSAEIWLNGRVVNSPSYGNERNIANALVVVEKPKKTEQ